MNPIRSGMHRRLRGAGRPLGRAGGIAALALGLVIATPAASHEASFPLRGKKLVVKADQGKKKRFLSVKAVGDFVRPEAFDPANGAALVINSLGKHPASTGRIRLPLDHWKRVLDRRGRTVGWKYKDASGSNGGIQKLLLKQGRISIKGGGARWAWQPRGKNRSVWLHLYTESEEFCAQFGKEAGAKVRENRTGLFVADGARAPVDCPEQTCGNGVHEPGEECDDGNLDDEDGCTAACERAACSGALQESTFDAIQTVVFEGYGCTNDLCHAAAAAAGGLTLEASRSWDDLVGVDSVASLAQLRRVEAGDPERSFLYRKLAAATLGAATGGGSPMPLPGAGGPPALSADHLEALRLWIRGGAPRDRVVEGSAPLLATCLPPPDPLLIEPLDPPPAGEGFQVQQPPRPLPAQSESETCASVFYDLTQTELVPPEWIVPCPPALQIEYGCSENRLLDCASDLDCEGRCIALKNRHNPSGLCVRYSRHVYAQDPQSHHALVREYRGRYAVEHAGWEGWQYRFADPGHPLNGQTCDPEAVNPETGVNAGCGSAVVSSVGCVDYGPPDFTVFDFSNGFGGILTGGSGSPSIAFAAEPYLERRFPEGASDHLPLRGIITWNSHAFNLTDRDSTLTQYLNLYFVDPEEHPAEVADFFDADSIFAANVPPFQTREYCRTFEVPRGQQLFELTSHTHRFGVLFRVWPPPNQPCTPADATCAPRDPDEAIYVSRDYADPLQLLFDPPIAHDEPLADDRSYLYCSRYDNGSTPESPPVKRQSTSPPSPEIFGFGIGGPCGDAAVACANEGPRKGKRCWGDDAACDSVPGAGDGDCDACPLRGGLTTEDEMFALPGSLVVPASAEANASSPAR